MQVQVPILRSLHLVPHVHAHVITCNPAFHFFLVLVSVDFQLSYPEREREREREKERERERERQRGSRKKKGAWERAEASRSPLTTPQV